MLLYPNCKINLGLRVVRKREDGYHDLETIFVPIYGLHDELEVCKGERLKVNGDSYSFIQEGLAVDCKPEDNLIIRCYEQMKAKYPQIGSVAIRFKKNIPFGAGLGGGHDEREQTLNQLLVEMDGFGINEGIIMIAATNRPDILDHALLRPGRFDRQIVVDRPDMRGREAILHVHAKGKPMAPDVDMSTIAKQTTGFTGADLANLVNEAALLTARRNVPMIDMKAMNEAAERVVMGPERRSHLVSEPEKKLTAYHETGHTLIGLLHNDVSVVHKVTIIPRGRAGGYTMSLPKEDRNYQTKSEMLDELQMLLGGRVAEAIVLKDISSGASSDLQRATALARKMVCQYGMSDRLGSMTFGHPEEEVFLGRDIARERYSNEVAAVIDEEVRRLMDEAYKGAEKLLLENMDKLVLIAETLMQKETLDGKQLLELMNQGYLTEDGPALTAMEQPVGDLG